MSLAKTLVRVALIVGGVHLVLWGLSVVIDSWHGLAVVAGVSMVCLYIDELRRM